MQRLARRRQALRGERLLFARMIGKAGDTLIRDRDRDRANRCMYRAVGGRIR